MTFRLRRLSLMAVGIATLVVVQSASADMQIVQTMTYPTSTTPFSDPLTFNSFNTALGTLNSVTISLTETGSATAQVLNFNSFTAQVSGVVASSNVTVQGPDYLSGPPATGTSVTATFTTTSYSGSVAPTPNPSMPDNVATSSGSATSGSSVASSNFGSYEGTGLTTYTVYAMGATTATGTSMSNFIFYGGVSTVGGSVTITYGYTPFTVPEPASLSLVAIGLGGLGLARRFRRKAA